MGEMVCLLEVLSVVSCIFKGLLTVLCVLLKEVLNSYHVIVCCSFFLLFLYLKNCRK